MFGTDLPCSFSGVRLLLELRTQVGQRLTLADLAMYSALLKPVSALALEDKTNMCNIVRWLLNIGAQLPPSSLSMDATKPLLLVKYPQLPVWTYINFKLLAEVV